MPAPPKTAKKLRDLKLAAALKANLKRRKAKARAKMAEHEGSDKAPLAPSSGPDTARKRL